MKWVGEDALNNSITNKMCTLMRKADDAMVDGHRREHSEFNAKGHSHRTPWRAVLK